MQGDVELYLKGRREFMFEVREYPVGGLEREVGRGRDFNLGGGRSIFLA